MIFFHKLRKVRNYPLYLSNNSVHQNCYHNTLGKCHGADYRIVRRIFQIFDKYMLTNISSIWRIHVDEYFKYLTNICWQIFKIFDEYMLTNISNIWQIYVGKYFKYLTNICWRIFQILDKYMLTNISNIWQIYVDEYFKSIAHKFVENWDFTETTKYFTKPAFLSIYLLIDPTIILGGIV